MEPPENSQQVQDAKSSCVAGIKIDSEAWDASVSAVWHEHPRASDLPAGMTPIVR